MFTTAINVLLRGNSPLDVRGIYIQKERKNNLNLVSRKETSAAFRLVLLTDINALFKKKKKIIIKGTFIKKLLFHTQYLMFPSLFYFK